MTVQTETAERLVPPSPEPAPDVMGPFELARRMRTNGISVYAGRAYEDEVIEREFLGRKSFVLNAPDAIRHVLVDHHERYGRTRATIRVLRPLLGYGLFLSEGRAWRVQRRALSPAFTPKAVSSLIPHMLAPTQEAIASLRARKSEPVDLFSAMQHLALEIAGRTMFSLEMTEHGAELRDFMVRYSRRLARPHLLDFLVPLGLWAPHDLPRQWFRRGWTAFVEQLVAKRQLVGPSAGPSRDLLDERSASSWSAHVP